MALVLLFLIPTIAIRSPGGQGVFPHKDGGSAGFAHIIVRVAEGGSQVVEADFFHEGTDAALVKTAHRATGIPIYFIFGLLSTLRWLLS